MSIAIHRPSHPLGLAAILLIAIGCSGAGGSGSSAAPSGGAPGAPANTAAGTETPVVNPAPTDGPAATVAVPEGDDATRTVALLDELAAMEDPTLEQFGEWFEKAFDDRIADETIPAFFDYVRARDALFQAVQYGESIRQPLADLLETRNPIAAMAGIAASTPRPAAAPTPTPDRADYDRPSRTEWEALIEDPEAASGRRYRLATCIGGPVALDGMIGQSSPTWRDDYWEGDETVFTGDEEIIMAIVGSSAKRLEVYATVVGWYTLDFRGGDQVPGLRLDDYEEPRGCME